MGEMYTTADLLALQRATLGYFIKEANPANGLIPDNTRQGAPSSIAAVGLALSCYAVAVERRVMRRDSAVARTLATLRFFNESPQGTQPNATGYQGFYYHFLDMKTGRRAWQCELSTMDTAILIAGALTAAQFFDRTGGTKRKSACSPTRSTGAWTGIGRETAGRRSRTAGRPKAAFSPRWEGYDEALILYLLGLGSPTYPLPAESYAAWTSTYQWRKLYGHEFLYAGPLFTHQLSHIWIDFRGIQDEYMRDKASTTSRTAGERRMCSSNTPIANPRRLRATARTCGGSPPATAPGRATRRRGHRAAILRLSGAGRPYGPDDGTLAPWAVVASLPFAPEIVLPTLATFVDRYPGLRSTYGFLCSFNPTFPSDARSRSGWISQGYYGLDQGPIVLMIENYRSGLAWRLMRACPYLVRGLRRAGFAGGWLGPKP